MDKSGNSNDSISLLLRIADALGDNANAEENTVLQQDDLNDTLRRLSDHFEHEKESASRAKTLSLIGAIGCLPGQDHQVSPLQLTDFIVYLYHNLCNAGCDG